MTEKFIVTTITQFFHGEMHVSQLILCSEFVEAEFAAKKMLEDPEDCVDQIDVYIDHFPALTRIQHITWRRPP